MKDICIGVVLYGYIQISQQFSFTPYKRKSHVEIEKTEFFPMVCLVFKSSDTLGFFIFSLSLEAKPFIQWESGANMHLTLGQTIDCSSDHHRSI